MDNIVNKAEDLSEIDDYLFENSEIIDRFMADNQDIFKAIKRRFKLYLDGKNVVARYLMARALNDLVREELAVSKGQVREQAFEKCGLFIMDADVKGVPC